MNDNRYPEIGLYYHNADSYDKVKEAYELGEKVVGIVHATGTGKSFNALQLAYDNRNKKVVYVVPSRGIIEHLKEIINSNPNLDLDRDFPNLEFRTYQSLVGLSKDEIKSIDCDLLVLDEFHHIGAPVWGARIDTMIETHPNMRIFGMTAYTVRDRGTPYERNMADPDKEELFSDKIVSRYDLCDAMVEGVLPKPVYKSAYIHLVRTADRLEEKVSQLNSESKDYKELIPILADLKKRIHDAPSIPELLQKSLKPNGKYIYFCPPCSEEGTNDIETIQKQSMEWFKKIYPGKEIVFYTSTSEMGIEGKRNRDAFYKDVTLDGKDASDKLRIMFAINQYNEGIHAPNIDGVIMGRGTCSDIVFFEQIGRALSVRGNTTEKVEELEKYSIEDLIKMCNEKDIPVKEGMTKDNIIEKLISPIIIDLTNNIDFIRDLENRLRDRIKNFNENGLGYSRRILNIDASFDIEMVNEDLFELLRYVMDRLVMTWEDKFELAKAYYEKHGNLLIPHSFKTINGYEYDENGTNLGLWISIQRQSYKGTNSSGTTLSEKQIKLLEEIGMVWDAKVITWQKNYGLAKAYYEKHGNLLIPRAFKTKNGYEYDEDGVSLGRWIGYERRVYRGIVANASMTEEQIKLLEEIGMVWDPNEIKNENFWQKNYTLAKAYYEKHGNLLIPVSFKTKNGYEPDENGVSLGRWIGGQRKAYKGSTKYKISDEHIKQLEEIGMIWDPMEIAWQENYELAKAYYEKHGNLLIPRAFKTKNGYEPDENGVSLGWWIGGQRRAYKGSAGYKMSDEHIKQLEEIGMVWDPNEFNIERIWQENYRLAKIYYESHGNLLIPLRFCTKNGIDFDADGINIGWWISSQRLAYKGYNKRSLLSESQIKLLEEIGMVWDVKEMEWQEKYTLAKAYYEKHGNLKIPVSFKTVNGYDADENGVKLGEWIANLRRQYKKNKDNTPMSDQRIKLLEEIGMIWEINKQKKKIK